VIRAIQWATGAMGRTSLRRIIDHPDMALAGAFVYSPRKAGLDAGQLVKRQNTGIITTSVIDDILTTDADVVLHMPRITLPYDALVDDVVQLLKSGKNVVSTAGFHWPEAQGSAYASRLQQACLAGGSTLAGVGVNPGLMVERLALAATALCADLEKIDISEMVDASAMASPEFVFGLMGLGTDPSQSDIRTGPLATLYTSLFSEVLYFSAHAMGTQVKQITPDHQLTLAPYDLEVAAGPIAKGTVAATQWCWNCEMDNGVLLSLSILWTADPRLHSKADVGHWSVDIIGRPNINMRIDISESDPTAPPARALSDATVAVAIRAIPDVVAAPPGLFAYQPPATWRANFV